MKKREIFIQDMEEKLENINLKITEYENKYAGLKSDVQKKLQSELEKMRAQREKMNYDLTQLRAASESAYADMEKGVKQAFETLKSAVHSAKDKLGI